MGGQPAQLVASAASSIVVPGQSRSPSVRPDPSDSCCYADRGERLAEHRCRRRLDAFADRIRLPCLVVRRAGPDRAAQPWVAATNSHGLTDFAVRRF